MSTATFTVPLTARVLRAILADIEGVDTLMSKCGCRTTEPEQRHTAKRIATPEEIAAYKGRAISHQQAEQDDVPLTSGVVEEVNPFVAPAPEAPFTTPTAAEQMLAECQTATPPTSTVPTPPTSTVPLDSEGLPWDKRIHASTRTRRVGDDTWKLMKGVDKALVEQVKAELRATMAVPAHPAFAEPTNYSGAQSGGYVPPAVVPHLSGSWTPETGHVVGVPAPPVTIIPAPPAPVATPQPPVVPVAPTPPAPGAPTTFSDFVTYATNKIVGKQFSRDQLQAACANEGITSMPMLENRPDLIPAIWKFLESISIQASSVGGE